LRRGIAALAVALFLVGCGSDPRTGQPVQLITVETQPRFGSCVLDLFYVADIVADATTGTPVDAATGEAFAWPKGFTARRAGSEVEVFDRAGNLVLTTGRRYRVCPAADETRPGSGLAAQSSRGAWVIGMVDACVRCELGGYGYPFDVVDCIAEPTASWCELRQVGPSPTPPQPPP
jgi:hypothetical protein